MCKDDINGADVSEACSYCCRGLAVSMDLSKVRGVWRLQAPQRWLTYISTCRTITAPAPLPPAQIYPLRKPWIDVRRWFARAQTHGTVSASAARTPAALTQAVQPTAGSTTRAGSVEMFPPSAAQPPLHCAVADLATVLNEQWMWHGTSYEVRYVQLLYALAGLGASDSEPSVN